MKAVVVFDVHDDFDFKSKANVQINNGGKCIYRTHLKIRPLPEPIWHEEGKENECEEWYKNGYNACLKKITGDTE